MIRNFALLLAVLVLFSGCISSADSARYREMTEWKEIDDYFSATKGMLTFSSLDEAYDFINCAKIVLRKDTFWHREKGQAAIISGPQIENEEPVTVVYILDAFSNKRNFSVKDGEVGNALIDDALGTVLYFLVFYDDKVISTSDYYIEEGWYWPYNTQTQSFMYQKNLYIADYPRGWGIEKAFEYLRNPDL